MEYTLCTYRIAEDIRPFVEVSKVDFPNKLRQNVSSNFMHQVHRKSWFTFSLRSMTSFVEPVLSLGSLITCNYEFGVFLMSSDVLSAHNLSQGDHNKSQAVDDERDGDEVEGGLQEGEGGGSEDEEAQIRRARKAARTREEKLQNDLFLLKKLNNAFSLYTDTLRATQSSTEVGRYHILITPVKVDFIGHSGIVETEGTSERHERVVGPIHRDA